MVGVTGMEIRWILTCLSALSVAVFGDVTVLNCPVAWGSTVGGFFSMLMWIWLGRFYMGSSAAPFKFMIRA